MSNRTKWRLYILSFVLLSVFVSFYKFDDVVFKNIGLGFLFLNATILYVRYEINLKIKTQK